MTLLPQYGGSGSGLTAEQEAALAAAYAVEDDDWNVLTVYADRTLVKRLGIWYELPAGAGPSTGNDPALGAPWAVFALTSAASGYPSTLAATHAYVAGRFYPLFGPNLTVALTTQAMAANRADLQLWTPDRNVTFDRLGLEITAFVAGNAKVLVYDSDAAGWANTLIYDSGSINVGANGYAFASASLPSFTAGTRYWVGHIADATGTARGISAPGHRSLGMTNSADAAIGYALRRSGLTFATPPATWTWVASDVASTANTVIVIGRAA